MERLFHDFYVQPMQQVYVETIALHLLWTFLMVLLKGRARRYLARVTALLGLALILLYTVIGRGTADVRVISLTPFITFERANVEAIQYFFRIGDCETDDVLMNTLGMLIGISSFGIVCLVQKTRKR